MRHKKHKSRISSAVKKRACAALLVGVMGITMVAGASYVPSVYAKTDAEIKRDEYKDKLKDAKEDIENIKGNQQNVKEDLEEASASLQTLLGKQQELKTAIGNKQEEIKKADESLEKAEKVRQEQYEAMKLRIQYLYENSTDNSLWTAIIESDGFADMLSRIEYASDIYQSDRDLMAAYEEAVQQVEDWSRQLAEEMDNLLIMKEQYEEQQGELDILIARLERKKDTYAEQLAEAKEQAEDYEKNMNKYAELVRAQEAAAAQQAANNYTGGGSGSSGSIGGDAYLQDPSYNPSNVTNVSGEDIVAYARQFVGNPYVWGGNSLTNGADCSGFVHLVYQHFGISTPRYSQSFKTVGQPVAYQNIQAGDVVVYPGHVAIYIGNGCIVEAQSTRAGITDTRPVNCHTITAIRRLV
ncbi:MAG: NlpC/P60 family protein [Lachnospiraceae bacterium]|nr:NlpC/P60 family protein [Lachnospiraceae bacterium]